MTPFEIAFPGYVQACSALFRDLLPFAFGILVIGITLEFWHEPATPEAVLKTFIRTFLILVFLLKSSDLINDGQAMIKVWVEQNIPARPERVAERYQEKLREAQQLSDRADASFMNQVLSGDWYEAIILAVLTLISWLAMAMLAFVYSVQRAVLLGCWALAPILVPCLGVRAVFSIGLQHVLRLLGIMLWPMGLALAATFTDGLIDVIGSGTSFANASFGEAVGKGLTGLLGIAALAIWIIFSTVLAPLYVQRLITGSGGPVAVVMRAGSMAGTAFVSTAAIARNYYSNNSQAAPPNTSNNSIAGIAPSAAQGAATSPDRLAPPPSPQPSPPSSQPSDDSPGTADPVGDVAAKAIVDRFHRKPS